MKRYLLAPALSALAMFLLGMIFWVSPFPYKVLGHLASEEATLAALAAEFPATGTYLLPSPSLPPEKADQLYRRGPSVLVHFIKEGHPPMDLMVFVKGYLQYFAVSLLLVWILNKSAAGLRCYCDVVKICLTVGLAAVVLLEFSDSIWWHHPWAWHLVTALYGVLAFFAAGLVLGLFYRPQTTIAPATT